MGSFEDFATAAACEGAVTEHRGVPGEMRVLDEGASVGVRKAGIILGRR